MVFAFCAGHSRKLGVTRAADAVGGRVARELGAVIQTVIAAAKTKNGGASKL